MEQNPEDDFGFPTDPDDGPDESPRLWLESEWLADTWTEPEQLAPSRTVDRFRHTGAGMVIGAIGMALRDIFEPEREEAPIIVQAPGEPPGPRRFTIELDDDPAASTVIYRPDIP